MDQRPLFLTRYALGRILKEFALGLGLKETFSDSLAQVHLLVSPSADRWSAFLETNCSTCEYEPSTCRFLNPTEKDILGEATPEDVQAATALSIEIDALKRCPAHLPAK